MANIDTDAPPPAVYSIEEFCRAHRISPSSFYKMKKLGLERSRNPFRRPPPH